MSARAGKPNISLQENENILYIFLFFRRENPHDAVVLHPKNAGKSLDTLPANRYGHDRRSRRRRGLGLISNAVFV